MHYLLFCTLILTLFSFLESKRPDVSQTQADFLPGPSASARARLRANRLKAKHHHGLERARCPFPLTSCLITPYNTTSSRGPSVLKSSVSWECIDLQQELTACGTCKNDCTSKPNVDSVGCEHGSCKIFTCQPGYTKAEILDEASGEIVTVCR